MNLKKCLVAIGIILLLILGYFASVFQCKRFYFPHYQRVGKIGFYTEDPGLDPNYCHLKQSQLMVLLKLVQQNLVTSPLYDSSNFEAEVHFTKSKWLHRSHSFFLSRADAFCLLKVNGNIYMYEPFLCVELEGRIVETLSHELTHKVLLDQSGKSKYGKTPKWLMEGYCEFVAKNYINVSTLKNNMRETKYVDGAFQKTINNYDNYLLAVCYLLIYERQTINQLLSNPPDYEAVLKKIEHWNFTPHNTLKIKNKLII